MGGAVRAHRIARGVGPGAAPHRLAPRSGSVGLEVVDKSSWPRVLNGLLQGKATTWAARGTVPDLQLQSDCRGDYAHGVSPIMRGRCRHTAVLRIAYAQASSCWCRSCVDAGPIPAVSVPIMRDNMPVTRRCGRRSGPPQHTSGGGAPHRLCALDVEGCDVEDPRPGRSAARGHRGGRTRSAMGWRQPRISGWAHSSA